MFSNTLASGFSPLIKSIRGVLKRKNPVTYPARTNHSRKFLFSTTKFQMSTNNTFKFAAIQLAVTADKGHNLKNAADKIKEAASNGAKVISLPVSSKHIFSYELFNIDLTYLIIQYTHIFTRKLTSFSIKIFRSKKKIHWDSQFTPALIAHYVKLLLISINDIRNASIVPMATNISRLTRSLLAKVPPLKCWPKQLSTTKYTL